MRPVVPRNGLAESRAEAPIPAPFMSDTVATYSRVRAHRPVVVVRTAHFNSRCFRELGKVLRDLKRGGAQLFANRKFFGLSAKQRTHTIAPSKWRGSYYQ